MDIWHRWLSVRVNDVIYWDTRDININPTSIFPRFLFFFVRCHCKCALPACLYMKLAPSALFMGISFHKRIYIYHMLLWAFHITYMCTYARTRSSVHFPPFVSPKKHQKACCKHGANLPSCSGLVLYSSVLPLLKIAPYVSYIYRDGKLIKMHLSSSLSFYKASETLL